jgi:hypothetical protein
MKNWLQISLPMPWDEPVTMATRLCRRWLDMVRMKVESGFKIAQI